MRALVTHVEGLSRTAFAADQSAITLAAKPTGASFVVDNDSRLFLAGWSGRGKTTALHILAAAALTAVPQRVPIFLRFERRRRSLFAHLLDALAIPGLGDEHAVRAWMQSVPTLVLVDDWQFLERQDRRLVESFASWAAGFPVAMAIAGEPTTPPPRVAGMRHLELRPYSVAERDAVLSKAVGADFNRPRWILETVPKGFAELLREPWILARFVQAIRFNRHGGMHLPHNLPEFMRSLLETIAASRSDAGARRADELGAVCRLLANVGEPIRLEAVADAARAAGAGGDAAAVAEDLCAAGVWRRVGAGAFVFDHRLWVAYFRVTAIAASGAWSESERVREWVRVTEEDDLRASLPFVTGLVDDADRQDALFSALLARDAELYLRGLATRGDARLPENDGERARCFLELLHRGYFELVEALFHGLKAELDPWCYGDGLEADRAEKPVIVGDLAGESLTYYLGFGPVTGPNVVLSTHEGVMSEPLHAPAYAVVSRGAHLGMMHRREGSGRLIATELLLENVEEILKKKQLPPVGWIARERFRDLCASIAGSARLPNAWPKWPVERARVWFEKKANALTSKGADAFVQVHGRGDRDAVGLGEIIDLADRVIADGFAETRIVDLGLPGPDRARRGRLGAAAYSMPRRIERARELYKAIATTYRALCEQFFSGATTHFFVAQFPCRAHVRVDAGSERHAGWQVWWEVVEHWDLEPVVEPAAEMSSEVFLELAEHTRADCARLGRPFIGFTVRDAGHMGLWWPWEPLVTNEVCSMLTSDVARLRRWLGNAS